MRLWLVLFVMLPSFARAVDLRDALSDLWSGELGTPPAEPGLLLLELANDAELAQRLIDRASPAQIALTDTLLATLALTENEARERWPQIYVVRDDSPASEFRPPSWPELRRVGVQLFEKLALRPGEGRDLRLMRELAQRREAMRRETPSEIAGLVMLCLDWWNDRGDDERYYLDAAQMPDVQPWLDGLGDDHGLWDLLGRLHDDPLRRRMFLDRLDGDRHAALVQECMEILGSYREDFLERGFAERTWDARAARMLGYNEADLWDVALLLFARITPHIPSGASRPEQILSAFGWWRVARYEARYWRDPRRAPELPHWLRNPRADIPMARILRDLYVNDELGELFAEELDERHQCFVAEWMAWLQLDVERARERGFELAVRRFPLRPERTPTSRMMAIPWDRVRDMMMGWLPSLTGHRLLVEDAPLDERVAQWLNWWRSAQRDLKWYRDPSQREVEAPLFEPQRARAVD